MKIERLWVKNYRNLKEQSFEPCNGINLIFGENAQGKTNLLEAIWLFTGLKSFRGASDSELVSFHAQKAQLSLDFYDQKRKQEIELTVQNRRSAVLNGVLQPNTASLIGHLRACVFSPSFLSVVKDGPVQRRKFADAAICQLYPAYAGLLAEYTRIIKQRNSLLKDIRMDSALLELLDVLDDRAAETGEKIIERRKNYLEALKPIAGEIYKGLSGGREEFSFQYEQAVKNSETLSLKELLYQNRKQDILQKSTGVGPHRDDIPILLNGMNARLFGSQGQQRSCALALKLGESVLLEKITGERPVILLDDVMSELDALRQDYILNHIKDRQVFITCCEPSQVLRMSSGKTVNIKQGMIV